MSKSTTDEQILLRAEEIKIAMARQSWNENTETIAQLLRQIDAETRNTNAANRNYQWAHKNWDEAKAQLAATEELLGQMRRECERLDGKREKLKSQLAATEEALAQVQRESAELREQCDEIRNTTLKECAKIGDDAANRVSSWDMRSIANHISGKILELLESSVPTQPDALLPADRFACDHAGKVLVSNGALEITWVGPAPDPIKRNIAEAAIKLADVAVKYVEFKGSIRDHLQLSMTLFEATTDYREITKSATPWPAKQSAVDAVPEEIASAK